MRQFFANLSIVAGLIIFVLAGVAGVDITKIADPLANMGYDPLTGIGLLMLAASAGGVAATVNAGFFSPKVPIILRGAIWASWFVMVCVGAAIAGQSGLTYDFSNNDYRLVLSVCFALNALLMLVAGHRALAKMLPAATA